MTTGTTTPTATKERPWLAGVILVAIGLVLLGQEIFTAQGWLVLGALAAVFLFLYAVTRQYGFVIPGMILAGLAIGVGLDDAGYGTNGAAVVLGLAGGFLGIYAAGLIFDTASHWWPLIPGSVLGIIGVSLVIGGTEGTEWIERYWPIALIAAGVLVLIGQMRGSAKT